MENTTKELNFFKEHIRYWDTFKMNNEYLISLYQEAEFKGEKANRKQDLVEAAKNEEFPKGIQRMVLQYIRTKLYEGAIK